MFLIDLCCRQCRGQFVEQVALHPVEDLQHGDFVRNLINQFMGPQHFDEDIWTGLTACRFFLHPIDINEKQLKNGAQCITCLEPFALDERVVAIELNEAENDNSVEPWLRLHNTCPICRAVVDPKKWPATALFDMWELD
uniref:RING-type domain-containing protein n=1 Tax=Ditylenchus dipsaci TaxID=166011 RepID=A0A915DKE1_9BILA